MDEHQEEQQTTVTDGRGRINFLNAASGMMAGRFPCGYVDPTTGEVYTEFVIKEMTGNEENLLLGSGLMIVLMNQILSNCIVSIGPLVERADIRKAVLSMTQADRETAMISLRRVSLGDFYEFKYPCPQCEDDSVRHRIDLSALELKSMQDPKHRRYLSTLETGREVQWHVMTARDGEWVFSNKKALVKNSLFTLSYLSRIEKIDNFTLDRDNKDNLHHAIELVSNFTYRECIEFRSLIAECEGGIDTNIELVCVDSTCKHKWFTALPVSDRSFFFPSEPTQNILSRSKLI